MFKVMTTLFVVFLGFIENEIEFEYEITKKLINFLAKFLKVIFNVELFTISSHSITNIFHNLTNILDSKYVLFKWLHHFLNYHLRRKTA